MELLGLRDDGGWRKELRITTNALDAKLKEVGLE